MNYGTNNYGGSGCRRPDECGRYITIEGLQGPIGPEGPRGEQGAK